MLMLYQFTIRDVILDKLNEIKVDVYELPLYQKTLLLFDVWATQKHLGYLFDQFDNMERKEKGLPVHKEITSLADSKTQPTAYKDQYIQFLMKHDLIFLVEEKDQNALLSLIYYWLLADVKKDKEILDNY